MMSEPLPKEILDQMTQKDSPGKIPASIVLGGNQAHAKGLVLFAKTNPDSTTVKKAFFDLADPSVLDQVVLSAKFLECAGVSFAILKSWKCPALCDQVHLDLAPSPSKK